MIKIGCRPSVLAKIQVLEIVKMYNIANYEIKEYKTTGDIDKKTLLSDVPDGSDFFTDAIETALLNGEIDIATHSAKDLPAEIPQGLEIAALTPSINHFDVFVSNGCAALSLESVPSGFTVGVCSQRRKQQLKNFRPDIKICDVRGNIDERLKLLDDGSVDGLILAAGLIRLGFSDRISQYLPDNIFTPHPLQGRLAVEVRADDFSIKKLFDKN